MKRTSPILIALILTLMCAAPLFSASAIAAPFPQSINGHAVNETGADFAGVTIRAVNTTTSASFEATTNVTGAYELSVPSGTYDVTASLINYTANHTYTLVVRDAVNQSSIDFRLTEMLGTVSGHITDGIVALGGVNVTLIGDTVNYTSFSTTPFGDYSITGITPGTYIARASKMGYNDSYHIPAVVIDRTSSLEINFVMVPQFSVLLGKVTLNGAPSDGVTVQLLQGSVAVKETLTDANGNYTITNVVAGDYLLKFTKSGLQDKGVQVSVAPNREQRIDVSMQLTPVEGLPGFIDGLDLTHSLMVVGLILALGMIAVAFFVSNKGKKKPDLLAVPEDEEKSKQEKDSGKKP
ncbi:MAG: carboxypeptidase-like regulatory domain-containing protein [Methanomassiliicoccales archaeon]|nr:carboxypeptidase-like regulatory domain-containing protein [Methanomassiliicoccales archaeon]